MNRPLVIAHRGDSFNAPENTLAAFQMAVDAGAEGVEFDVQLSSDGVPVVIHDYDLKRTGSRAEKVTELTSKQLGQTDVGSWFNGKFTSRARPEFANERVPTLVDVLKLLNNFDGLIYIELKAEGEDFRDLAAAVCDVIRHSQQLPQMIVKSFKIGAIPLVRHLLPTVQTAALFAPEIMTYLRRREHIIALAREFGAHQISVHYTLVTPRLCSLATRSGMPLTVWTVDDTKWIERRKNCDIRALITNDPSKFIQRFQA